MKTPIKSTPDQLVFRSFDDLRKNERSDLARSFSGNEVLAREFWEEIGNEVEICQMMGCGFDLQMKRMGRTASDTKSRMTVIYNSCRRLLQELDTETCSHLIQPPDVTRLSSLQREERRLKLEMLRSLLHEVATDADPDRWRDNIDPLKFRLDYVLASKIQQEVECADAEHRLSVVALVNLVFQILGINTEAKDAIKGARQIFREGLHNP